MSDLQPLISRIEEATEGSRDLDLMLWSRFVADPRTEHAQRTLGYVSPPSYSTSVDAALALIERQGEDVQMMLNEALEDMGRSGYRLDQPMVPQIARYLCLALLRALSSREAS